MMIYLDTHVLLWLWLGDTDKISRAAREAAETADLLASPVSLLELELLHEIGRLEPSASALISTLASDIGLRVCELPFRTVAEHGLKENWTSDPFDRLLVANARAAGAALITKDERIRAHYARAIW